MPHNDVDTMSDIEFVNKEELIYMRQTKLRTIYLSIYPYIHHTIYIYILLSILISTINLSININYNLYIYTSFKIFTHIVATGFPINDARLLKYLKLIV